MSRFQIRCTEKDGTVSWLHAVHVTTTKDRPYYNRFFEPIHPDAYDRGIWRWHWGTLPTWFRTERIAKARLKVKHAKAAIHNGKRVDIVEVIETHHVVHSSVEDAVSKLGLLTEETQ